MQHGNAERALHRDHDSLRNCLLSIVDDSRFVDEIRALYPSLPTFANLRCGLWYTSTYDGTSYFKSTDGHFGNWSFSSTRLNFNVVQACIEHGGCVIVDATRRGKTFPDAFTKTVPIWAAVVNRVAHELRGQEHTAKTHSLPSPTTSDAVSSSPPAGDPTCSEPEPQAAAACPAHSNPTAAQQLPMHVRVNVIDTNSHNVPAHVALGHPARCEPSSAQSSSGVPVATYTAASHEPVSSPNAHPATSPTGTAVLVSPGRSSGCTAATQTPKESADSSTIHKPSSGLWDEVDYTQPGIPTLASAHSDVATPAADHACGTAAWDTELHLPLHVAPTERAHITERLPGFVAALTELCSADMAQLLCSLEKPLRPLWISQRSLIWVNEVARPESLPFFPLLLVSASDASPPWRRVTNVPRPAEPATCLPTGERAPGRVSDGSYMHIRRSASAAQSNTAHPTDGEASVSCSYMYVPGAGDDEETWACGLSPARFWHHWNELLSHGDPSQLHAQISALMLASKHAPERISADVVHERMCLNPEGTAHSSSSCGEKDHRKPNQQQCFEMGRPSRLDGSAAVNLGVKNSAEHQNDAAKVGAAGEAEIILESWTSAVSLSQRVWDRCDCVLDISTAGVFQRERQQPGTDHTHRHHVHAELRAGGSGQGAAADLPALANNGYRSAGSIQTRGQGHCLSKHSTGFQESEGAACRDPVPELGCERPAAVASEIGALPTMEAAMSNPCAPCVAATLSDSSGVCATAEGWGRVLHAPVKDCKVERLGLLHALPRALAFLQQHLKNSRRVMIVDDDGCDLGVCMLCAHILASRLRDTIQNKDTMLLNGVQKVDVHRALAQACYMYPSARPKRGNVKQVFAYFHQQDQ